MKNCPQKLNMRLFWHKGRLISGNLRFFTLGIMAARAMPDLKVLRRIFNLESEKGGSHICKNKIKQDPAEAGFVGNKSTLTGKPRSFHRKGSGQSFIVVKKAKPRRSGVCW